MTENAPNPNSPPTFWRKVLTPTALILTGLVELPWVVTHFEDIVELKDPLDTLLVIAGLAVGARAGYKVGLNRDIPPETRV